MYGTQSTSRSVTLFLLVHPTHQKSLSICTILRGKTTAVSFSYELRRQSALIFSIQYHKLRRNVRLLPPNADAARNKP
ncbi:hypothetical protein PM082_015442 [Marasmius tenuissimus]|nr:hypothetical protein PM082_015442 [Marasmius tenuissimus]